MKKFLLLIAAVCFFIVPVTATAGTPSSASLQKQIKALNAKVNRQNVRMNTLSQMIRADSYQIDSMAEQVRFLVAENDHRKGEINYLYAEDFCFFVLGDDFDVVIVYAITGTWMGALDDKGTCAAIGIKRTPPIPPGPKALSATTGSSKTATALHTVLSSVRKAVSYHQYPKS